MDSAITICPQNIDFGGIKNQAIVIAVVSCGSACACACGSPTNFNLVHNFYTIETIFLKLHIHVHHHKGYNLTNGHNSVRLSDKIMPLYRQDVKPSDSLHMRGSCIGVIGEPHVDVLEKCPPEQSSQEHHDIMTIHRCSLCSHDSSKLSRRVTEEDGPSLAILAL